MASPPTPTPTPTPIFPPVDKPLEPESAEPESEVDVAVAVAPVAGCVVVADTKKLLSVAWYWTEMGCAHIVSGPVTWVPWFDFGSRTETRVELEEGNLLRHPA